MKTRSLYLVIFILVITTLVILVYIKNKILEIKPLVINGPTKSLGQVYPSAQSSGPVFYHKEAVTVIRKATGKVKIGSGDDKNEIFDYQDKQDFSSRPGTASATAEAQEVTKDSGVSIQGKYPDEEKVKEMNSQGIVIY